MSLEEENSSRLRGKLLRQNRGNDDIELTSSRLRGKILSKKSPETESFDERQRILMMFEDLVTNLNNEISDTEMFFWNPLGVYPEIKSWEDWEPIATKVIIWATEVFVNSVADGLWWSWAEKLEIWWTNRTKAYIASRAVQYVIAEIVKNEPNFLLSPLFKRILEEKINDMFRRLKSTFWASTSRLTSKMKIEYPTTISTSVIEKWSDWSTKVKCYYLWDSPIFIITPDKIYTTLKYWDGDAPIWIDWIVSSDNNTNLNFKEFSFPSWVPLLILNCSDGFIKFWEWFIISKLAEFLMSFNWTIWMTKSNIWNQYSSWSLGKEWDDTTISLSALVNSEEEFKSLIKWLSSRELMCF